MGLFYHLRSREKGDDLMYKESKIKELEWGGTASLPSILLSLLTLCTSATLMSCVNPYGTERRGPFPSLHSPLWVPVAELTVGTIKTFGKKRRGGGRGWNPLVPFNKSQTLSEQQETLAPLQSLPEQDPPKDPHPVLSACPSLFLDPKHPSSPAPFTPTSLSPAHKLRGPSLPLYVLLTAPGHRDFSSAGATFTLAPGSAVPLNHNTAIQHTQPSQSSSLMLQATEKNFTIAPQKGRNEKPGNCSCALGEQESLCADSRQPQSP